MYLKMMYTLRHLHTEKYENFMGNLHLFIFICQTFECSFVEIKIFLIVLPSLSFGGSFTFICL